MTVYVVIQEKISACSVVTSMKGAAEILGIHPSYVRRRMEIEDFVRFRAGDVYRREVQKIVGRGSFRK